MPVVTQTHNRTLTVALTGEIDHHHMKGILGELEGEVDELLPRVILVDCAGITFMDSSGIALLLRLWRRMEELEGRIQVVNLPPQPRRVLNAAGIGRLITIE